MIGPRGELLKKKDRKYSGRSSDSKVSKTVKIVSLVAALVAASYLPNLSPALVAELIRTTTH